jgi:hypothetical protein
MLLLAPSVASAQVADCDTFEQFLAYDFFVDSGFSVEDAVDGFNTDTDEKSCTRGCKQTGKACQKSEAASIKDLTSFLKNVSKQAKKLCGSIDDSAEKRACKVFVKNLQRDDKAFISAAKRDSKIACRSSALVLACSNACVLGSTSSVVDCSTINFP